MGQAEDSADDQHARLQRWRPWVERLLIVALGLLTLVSGVGGFGAVTSHYSGQILNVVVDPLYPARHREDVTAVVLGGDDLAEFGESYPPRAELHAGVVRALIPHRPTALFIDIIFAQDRDDSTFANLRVALEEFRQSTGAPIFIAVHPGPNGRYTLQKDMAALAGSGAVTPVYVTRADRSGLSQNYVLRYPADPGDGAALALYRAHCRAQRLSCAAAPDRDFESNLHMVWSSKIAPFNFSEQCQPPEPWLVRVWNVTKGRFPALSCTYTPTMSVAALVLTDTADEALKKRLENRLVIYGMGLSGVGDTITPPFHIALPGLYAHAMALDNLLLWGPHYLRAEIHGLEWLHVGKLVDIGTMGLVLLIPLMLGDRLQRWRWGRRAITIFALDPKPPRQGAVMADALRDASRWLRHLVPGLAIMLAVIAFEVFALHLAPLNWLGIAAIATAGKLAHRPVASLMTLLMFLVFSPKRGLVISALWDRKSAGILRAELPHYADSTH